MDNFLRKSFYNNNELMIIKPEFTPIVAAALNVHEVNDNELIDSIVKIITISASLISGDQRLSLVLKNYKDYHKIILTVNGRLNFQISVDNTPSNDEFSGYIIHETNGDNFHAILEDKELPEMIDLFISSSEQVNWFFKGKELIVPLPEVNKADALEILEKINNGDASRNSYFDYKVKNDCNCSREKYLSKLSRLEKNELDFIFDETDIADVVCEWCKTTYTYNREDLEKI